VPAIACAIPAGARFTPTRLCCGRRPTFPPATGMAYMVASLAPNMDVANAVGVPAVRAESVLSGGSPWHPACRVHLCPPRHIPRNR
jgi:hypothetical protein